MTESVLVESANACSLLPFVRRERLLFDKTVLSCLRQGKDDSRLQARTKDFKENSSLSGSIVGEF